MRRARVLALPVGDLYREAFQSAEALGTGWAAASKRAMDCYDIPDWRDLPDELDYGEYGALVRGRASVACLPAWSAAVSRLSNLSKPQSSSNLCLRLCFCLPPSS